MEFVQKKADIHEIFGQQNIFVDIKQDPKAYPVYDVDMKKENEKNGNESQQSFKKELLWKVETKNVNKSEDESHEKYIGYDFQ